MPILKQIKNDEHDRNQNKHKEINVIIQCLGTLWILTKWNKKLETDWEQWAGRDKTKKGTCT